MKYVVLESLPTGCFCGKAKMCENALTTENCQMGPIDEEFVIVDMTRRSHIGSDYCRQLLIQLIHRKKKIYLANCKGQPRQIINILRLQDHVTFCDSVEEAIKVINLIP